MRRLWLDFETRSLLNLKNIGLDRYAKDPSTEVLMLAWAVDEGTPRHWQPCLGEPMPAEIHTLIMDSEVKKCAWNFNFEKDILQFKLGIAVPLDEWYDPSVLCAYMSLPIGLDRAGNALNIDSKKIRITGDNRPIKLFSNPSKSTKKMIAAGTGPSYFKDWNTHPAEWALFCEYNKQDVIAERAVWHAAMDLKSPITPGETAAWLLDQRMNDNGVWIDQPYVHNAMKMAKTEVDKLIGEMKLETGLDNPNSTQQLIGWLKQRGYPHDSVDVEHVEDALNNPAYISPLALKILGLKQKLGGSAYKKLQSILDRMGEDGRLRDQFLYHGAHTGRWAGRGVQLQNLYKPDRAVSEHLDAYVRGIRAGKIIISKNSQMELVASTIRAAFAASPGCKLIVGDLAQIESRVLAALTQCYAMTSAYAEGRDLYKEVMAAQLKKPLSEVTKADRDRGKVIILGCGFGMGWEKFIEYALIYGITLTEKEAKDAVYGFRDTYVEVVNFWRDINNAVIRAFKCSICVFLKGLVIDGRDDRCLKILLPSGRYIHYHQPRLEMEPPPWDGPDREVIHFIMYSAKGAEDKRLYGGLLTENIVQAISRDILLNGMIEAEKMGFKILMTIHDEIAAEVALDSLLGLNDLLKAMCLVPEWGEGMGFVLKAEGYEGAYYRK